VKIVTVLAVLILLSAATTQASPAGAAALIDDALRAVALERDDLSFRTDYADHPDSFRLTVVDSLLTFPLDTEGFVRSAADAATAAGSLEGLVASCAYALDLRLEGVGCVNTGEQMEPKGTGPEPLDALLPALNAARELVREALSGLSDDEREFLHENAPVLLEEEEFDPDKPIEEREREEKRDEALGEELLDIAGRVDYASLAEAGRVMAAAVDAAVPLARDLADRPPAARSIPADAPARGDVLRVFETRDGLVVIGGPGRTIYERPCAVVIDIGGDDMYLYGGAADPTSSGVVIDVSGDDTYAGEHHSFAGGFLGVSILVDLEGDDTYRAGSFAVGSGLFGVGVLNDRAGNDRYVGDTCVQGSGAFGIGILLDEGGNDVYESALFSQAFGFVKGVGLLLDKAGNDLYVAGLKYTDEIRYFDHYLSLSQGFGFGWRPDASGGIGLLVDVAGNDVYSSDIFGQGSSYWFAVGGLVDYAGNDQYVSYQYAQGAGTHITVAALVDIEGDDNYVSKGVSQGCGHDLAIGIIHDLAGDDNYTCHDLSQAAGNANGIGVLLDDGGDDAYSVRNPLNTHGYGNRRREYGSIGLFIDAGGSDAYTGLGSDGTWWTQSLHGVGVDADEGGDR